MNLSRPRADAGPLAMLPSRQGWPMFDAIASRRIEQAAIALRPAQSLMGRAGLGVARLALAVAPQARRIWVAAGPGNNGGDGLVAARHLHRQGLDVRVSLLGEASRMPEDARDALAQAQQAGVWIGAGPDCPWQAGADLGIDALLGLGTSRAPEGAIEQAARQLNAGTAPVLAVDLPTGLCGDSGRCLGEVAVVAAHTLSLLTLKPGLFTGQGRDHAGRVWLDELGVDTSGQHCSSWLTGPEYLLQLMPKRAHAQHKGSFGDVLVLGGAPGMGGAAMLAARAALTAGAGRVYLTRIDEDLSPDAARPELMPRSVQAALAPDLLARATVVCGCGGGHHIGALLSPVLDHAARLVLDADALNALAADPALQSALRARATRGQPTVLTPHPLEAARLLGCSAATVQAQRLHSAQALAGQLQAVVVLKGSGTVIASVGKTLLVNPTGNARLGTAGSGDVLAGWLAGLWSQAGDPLGRDAAAASVWLHGWAAEQAGDARLALRAGDLIDAMAACMPWPG